MASIRERLNETPAIAYGILGVSIAILLGVVFFGGGSGDSVEVEAIYYYNVNTGKLETVELTDPPKLPPITNDAGDELVRAFVYTKGECEESQLLIVWLERYTPDGKAAVEERRASDGDDAGGGDGYVNQGKELALPPENPGDPLEWFDMTTDYAMQLQQGRFRALIAEGDDGILTPCHPNK